MNVVDEFPGRAGCSSIDYDRTGRSVRNKNMLKVDVAGKR